MALEEILMAYIPLLEALAADDLEAAAFFLDVAAEAEAERAAPEVLVAARELLPPDLALELSLRQTELKLAAVQAAIRKLEEGYER